jgi:hypothetical protein
LNTANINLTPIIDLDLLTTNSTISPAVLTLMPFLVGPAGPQGPPGGGGSMAVNPDPSVNFESNNVQDGFIELAGDIKEIQESQFIPAITLDW